MPDAARWSHFVLPLFDKHRPGAQAMERMVAEISQARPLWGTLKIAID
jgi:hypothetical protein